MHQVYIKTITGIKIRKKLKIKTKISIAKTNRIKDG